MLVDATNLFLERLHELTLGGGSSYADVGQPDSIQRR